MIKKTQHIPSGDKGIDITVANMWRLIKRDVNDPIIKALANKLKGSDELETIKNTYEYVWKNHPYKSDPAGVEQLTAPVNMVNGSNPREDCDGLVMLLVCLLLANNIDAQIKTIAWRKRDYTHVIAEVKYNNNWIPLDPTLKDEGFGDQVRKVIREKRYKKNMPILNTLEDDMQPRKCCKKKTPEINNIINIGNEENINTELFKNLKSDNDIMPVAKRSITPSIIQKPEKSELTPLTVVKNVDAPGYIPIVQFIHPKGTKTYKEFY